MAAGMVEKGPKHQTLDPHSNPKLCTPLQVMRKVEKDAFLAAAAQPVAGFEPCKGEDDELNAGEDPSSHHSSNWLSMGGAAPNSSTSQNETSSRRGGGPR